MLSLPKTTELNKQLPKTAIYKKFNLTSKEQERFDEDISRLYIVNEISPMSVNIAEGETVKSFYVIHVILKNKNYDVRNVQKLFKLVDNNILLALEFENEIRLSVFRNKVIESSWTSKETVEIKLIGLNLDTVWESVITQVGGIEIEQGNTLDEQITSNAQREKIEKEIARLEKLARAEKQPKKKFELVEKIQILKRGLNIE